MVMPANDSNPITSSVASRTIGWKRVRTTPRPMISSSVGIRTRVASPEPFTLARMFSMSAISNGFCRTAIAPRRSDSTSSSGVTIPLTSATRASGACRAR